MYTENYTTSLEEIKVEQMNGRIYHVHESVLVRCQFSANGPTESTHFYQNPSSLFTFFLVEIEKLILKLIQKFIGLRMRKKNKIGRLILPDLKTYKKATIIKTV